MRKLKTVLRYYFDRPLRLLALLLLGWIVSVVTFFVFIQIMYLKPIYFFVSNLGLEWFLRLCIVLVSFLVPIQLFSKQKFRFFEDLNWQELKGIDYLLIYSISYSFYFWIKKRSCGDACYVYGDLRTPTSLFIAFLTVTILFLKRNIAFEEDGFHLDVGLRQALKKIVNFLASLFEKGTRTLEKETSHQKPVYQVSDRYAFEYAMFYDKRPIGTVMVVDREKTKRGHDRIVGAAVYTNAQELRKNERLIRNKKIQRSGSSRKSADVPGYQFLAGKFNRFVDGKKRFLWHRTHLIPYRHSLSEGDDIPNILFAGTAHLNSGNRPDIDYVVKPGYQTRDSRDYRKDHLYESFTCYVPLISQREAQGLVQNQKSIFQKHYGKIHEEKSIDVPYAPKGSRYSLDDVEQTVDMIIRDHPKKDFVYSVFLDYQNDTDVAPKWVTALLIDQTSQAIVFKITLLNDL